LRVPAGDGHHPTAEHGLEEARRVLRDVAEALDRRATGGRVEAELLERLANGDDEPVASVRPRDPPPPSGLPVMTPGVYSPTSFEYSSIIQPII
jgi:hypothetical protein